MYCVHVCVVCVLCACVHLYVHVCVLYFCLCSVDCFLHEYVSHSYRVPDDHQTGITTVSSYVCMCVFTLFRVGVYMCMLEAWHGTHSESLPHPLL